MRFRSGFVHYSGLFGWLPLGICVEDQLPYQSSLQTVFLVPALRELIQVLADVPDDSLVSPSDVLDQKRRSFRFVRRVVQQISLQRVPPYRPPTVKR